MRNFKVTSLLIATLSQGCGRQSQGHLESVDVGTESKLEAGSCKIELEVNSPHRLRKWTVRITDSIAVKNAWGQRMEPRKVPKRGDRITLESPKSVAFDFKTVTKGDGYGVLVPYEGEVTIDIDVSNGSGRKRLATKTIKMLAKDLPTSDFVLDELELEWKTVKKHKSVKKHDTASIRLYAACDKKAEPAATVSVEDDEDAATAKTATGTGPSAPDCQPLPPGQVIPEPVNCGYVKAQAGAKLDAPAPAKTP